MLSIGPAAASELPACATPELIRDEGYAVCADQQAIYASALARAQAANKPLLVEVVASWCPQCHALRRALNTPEGQAAAANFERVEIVTSTIAAGKKADLPSGEAVLARLQTNIPAGAPMRGWPYLLLIASDGRTLAGYNTEAIAGDSEQLAALLGDAAEAITTDQPMPAGPAGRNLWQRLLSRLTGG